MLTKETLYSVHYQIDHNINKRCVELKNIQTFCETGWNNSCRKNDKTADRTEGKTWNDLDRKLVFPNAKLNNIPASSRVLVRPKNTGHNRTVQWEEQWDKAAKKLCTPNYRLEGLRREHVLRVHSHSHRLWIWKTDSLLILTRHLICHG